MSDQFVNVRKYLHTLGKVLINFPSACQHFWTLSLLCFSILSNTIVVTYSRPQATFLNITLIVTVIICVSEADPPSDDSVTTYGCYQIRSNNPLPHPNRTLNHILFPPIYSVLKYNYIHTRT